ncbi:hypothetical protein [Fusobacterium canifelinum]|uniref:Uncharacterized protein n=1 Tax=Fusobacterium canifelinum TaxID=285729 RepID=A0A3P1V4I6_9FUSO|nr:hypothetical protein [Fusobacterium canifelinum]QQB73154.1 hypothetical protein I6H56_07450 [Fusobacterium canifelinum]RRD28370.1 hypothetical protein EII27_01760 [Fusobacterium canifelinum]
MKIIKAIKLDKYNNIENYKNYDDYIYEDLKNDNYCITLYCELEPEEDTQYPLEDILDQYYVNCTNYMETEEINGKIIYKFEIEGSLDKEENLENILAIKNLIGKRVYNYENGDYIELGIE